MVEKKGKEIEIIFIPYLKSELLKKMSDKHPNKMQWFADQETSKSKWRSDVMYKDVIKWKTQTELFDDDFNSCDSGYCGL